MAVVKNKDDQESRKFWSHVEAVAKEVETWPQWTGNRSQQPQEHEAESSTEGEDSDQTRAKYDGFR